MFLGVPVIVSIKEIIKKVRLMLSSKLIIVELLDHAGTSEEILKKPNGKFIEIGKNKHLIHPDFFIMRGKHKKVTVIDGVLMPSMYFNNFDFKTYELTESEVNSLTDEQRGAYENYRGEAKLRHEMLLRYASETFDNHISNAKLSSKLGDFNLYEKKIFYALIVIGLIALVGAVVSFLLYNDITPFIRAGFNPTNTKNGILSI